MLFISTKHCTFFNKAMTNQFRLGRKKFSAKYTGSKSERYGLSNETLNVILVVIY